MNIFGILYVFCPSMVSIFFLHSITEKDYEEVGVDSTEETGEGDEY